MSKAHKGVKFNKAISAIEEAIVEDQEKNKVSVSQTILVIFTQHNCFIVLLFSGQEF